MNKYVGFLGEAWGHPLAYNWHVPVKDPMKQIAITCLLIIIFFHHMITIINEAIFQKVNETNAKTFLLVIVNFLHVNTIIKGSNLLKSKWNKCNNLSSYNYLFPSCDDHHKGKQSFKMYLNFMKSYFIFVTFFTQPQFEAWKFYTWKCVILQEKLPHNKTA